MRSRLLMLLATITTLFSIPCYSDFLPRKEISDTKNNITIPIDTVTITLPGYYSQLPNNPTVYNTIDKNSVIIIKHIDTIEWSQMSMSGFMTILESMGNDVVVLQSSSSHKILNENAYMASIYTNLSEEYNCLVNLCVFHIPNTTSMAMLAIGQQVTATTDYMHIWDSILDSILLTDEKKNDSETEPTSNNRDATDISPEFRQAMEDYKAFFEEYAEIMDSVKEGSTDPSLLGKYANFLSQYSSTMDAFEKVNEDELTDAENKLYLETSLEIQKILYGTLD